MRYQKRKQRMRPDVMLSDRYQVTRKNLSNFPARIKREAATRGDGRY